MKTTALGATAAVMLSAAIGAQAAWTEVRDDQFVLRGKLASDALTAVACDLTVAASVLSHSGRGNVPELAAPQAIAVDNARDMRDLLPQFWERRGARPLGAYWSGLYGHHIVIRADARPEERLRRVLHEYAHFATHLAHPDAPRWLDEGLSEIWEHAAIAGGEIEVGRPVAAHMRTLRAAKNWIPVAELLSATTLPAEGGDSAVKAFYAASWALAHYLIFEKGGGDDLLLSRVPDRSAFPTDEELRAYVGGPLPAVRISTALPTAGGCPGDAVSQPVSATDSLIFRAQALADGERPDAAMSLLEDALRLAPGDPRALETLGFVHFVGNRAAQAAAIFDDLIAAGSRSHVAYYYRAMLAGPVPVTSQGRPVPEIDYLKRALQLAPGFLPARERLQELEGKVPLAISSTAVRE